MKATLFNNYMETLKTDRTAAECAAWAIMQMTERQICKVIDWYVESAIFKVEYKNYTMVVSFGGMWSYPISEYEKFGKYDLLNSPFNEVNIII